MIALMDESGNTSNKPSPGTSQYFVVGVVLFQDNDVANECDARIDKLREELGYVHDFEFHFTDNSDRVRKAFLNAVKDYDFQYFAAGINKYSEKFPEEFKNRDAELYKYISAVTLSSCLPFLNASPLIIDKSGSQAFQASLRKYIREELNDKDGKHIKKFKPQESVKNNLLQLADYCVGIIARKMSDKKGWADYYRIISKREFSVIELLK